MKTTKQTILCITLILGLSQITLSAPPALNQPEEWLKPLQDIKDLKECVEIQRYIALLEYADATNNNALYLQARDDFFKSLRRNVSSGTRRIMFILAIWPGMMQHKNFDGLKEAMTDIGVMMDKRQVKSQQWAYFNAILAGFSLALNDKDSADMYLKAGDSSAKYYMDLPNAVAWKPINFDNTFDKLPVNLQAEHYGFYRLAIHLAQKGDKSDYTKFVTKAKGKSDYQDVASYTFAIADARIGEFDRARLHWNIYKSKHNEFDSLYCLSYIFRQEFLAGEFRGWETKDQVLTQLLKDKEKDILADDIGGSALPQFYFDYGRGIARHKTNQEITEEYDTLAPKLAKDELAFFMAGVATGLQDKKNPK